MRRQDGQWVMFICEGAAERFIVDTLIERGELSIPSGFIVRTRAGGWTFGRKDGRHLATILNVSYGTHPLLVVRVVDSDSDTLKVPRGYEDRIRVVDLRTQPEIEILVIINEGKYDKYTNGSHRPKPSDYCKGTLHYRDVKKRAWLERYWAEPGDLEHAIREYARLHQFRNGENRGLVELLDDHASA